MHGTSGTLRMQQHHSSSQQFQSIPGSRGAANMQCTGVNNTNTHNILLQQIMYQHA
jgi:hypothetical protein